MSDYYNDEQVFNVYLDQSQQHTVDLNEELIRLKSKIAGEEFSGLNPEATKHLIDLSKMVVALKTKIAFLEKRILRYEKVPVQRTVLLQIVELERDKRKLEEDVEYYKQYVPTQIIINRESKDKPTRRGGLK